MAFFHDMRNSRTVKFLTIHAITSLAVSIAMMVKFAHVKAPLLIPYLIAFVQTFFGSLAGAFIGLNVLVVGAIRGYNGAGDLVLFGHSFPIPVVAGAFSLLGVILAVAGKQMYRSKGMYFLFFLASLLFMASSYVSFIDMGEHAGAVFGHPAYLQTEK